MFINRDFFIAVVKEVAEVREVEIGCDECFEQVDRFIEVELSGLDAAQAMPLVQEHLRYAASAAKSAGCC